jgi:hypothetical protein
MHFCNPFLILPDSIISASVISSDGHGDMMYTPDNVPSKELTFADVNLWGLEKLFGNGLFMGIVPLCAPGENMETRPFSRRASIVIHHHYHKIQLLRSQNQSPKGMKKELTLWFVCG